MFISEMLSHYIVAALWSSNDESTEAGGEPMDAHYGPESLDPTALAKMEADCAAFVEKCKEAGIDIESEDPKQVGHDFWLTRNRHGCGFWDGDWLELGTKLTEISHALGSCDLYVADTVADPAGNAPEKRIFVYTDRRGTGRWNTKKTNTTSRLWENK